VIEQLNATRSRRQTRRALPMCLFALVASRVWKIVGSRRSFGNRRRRSDPRATIVRMPVALPWARGSSDVISPPPRNLLSIVSVRVTLKPRKEVNVHTRYGYGRHKSTLYSLTSLPSASPRPTAPTRDGARAASAADAARAVSEHRMRRWTAAACCVCGEPATVFRGPRISTTHGTH